LPLPFFFTRFQSCISPLHIFLCPTTHTHTHTQRQQLQPPNPHPHIPTLTPPQATTNIHHTSLSLSLSLTHTHTHTQHRTHTHNNTRTHVNTPAHTHAHLSSTSTNLPPAPWPQLPGDAISSDECTPLPLGFERLLQVQMVSSAGGEDTGTTLCVNLTAADRLWDTAASTDGQQCRWRGHRHSALRASYSSC